MSKRKKEMFMNDTQRDIHSTDEKVISVVPNVIRKKGLLGLRQESYTVIVTEQRLLFARVNKALLARQAEELKQLRKQNKAEGRGFLASWGDSIATGLSWYNRYLEMAPETILAESGENFFLKKSDILTLKIVGHIGLNHADPQTPLPFFTIKTREQKYKFLLQKGADPGQLKMLKNWNKSSQKG